MQMLSVEQMKAFCKDFQLNEKHYHRIYLEELLLGYKFEYTIQNDLNGFRKLIVKDNNAFLYEKCMEIIDIIDDPIKVTTVLNNLWGKINFYYYEVFICITKIFKTLGHIKEERLDTLTFLKNYNRVSKPGQAEIEQWFTNFPDAQAIDPLSEWRLAFTETLFSPEIFKIIKPEINLKTYRLWFNAVTILKDYLKRDDICIYAVKHATNSISCGDEAEWGLYPKHEELFEEIDMCIQNIDDIEKATSTVYLIVNSMPKG